MEQVLRKGSSLILQKMIRRWFANEYGLVSRLASARRGVWSVDTPGEISGGESMDRHKGKVALISGGARGQGAAEARLFVGEGAKVVIGDGLDDECRKTADGMNARFGAKSAIALHLDVTRAADWRAAVETCEREFGGLDILINNAGIANVKGLEETSEEEWDSIVNINQKGVWLGMKNAVPAMRKRGAGSIINISSIYGLIGSAGSTAYHGSKRAVRLITKS